MIQDILLPERIGTYHLFGKRVLGIEITKTHVFATVVYFNGSKIIIEQCLEALIEQHNGDTAALRTGTALKKICTLAGKFHEIRFALSSTHIIFKTMHLPFDSTEKIKKVIDFEVEPLLPFSIADAVIDFIITRSNPERLSSDVLIAAAPKQYITQQLELFSQAELTPEVITVDLFELYGFYAQLNAVSSGDTVLIEITGESTKVLFISDGQLRFVRTIAFNIDTSKNTQQDQSAYMQPTGTEPTAPKIAPEPFANAKAFADAIRFTLQSFTSQGHASAEPPTIYILGEYAHMPGLSGWLEQSLTIPTSLFDPTRITELPHISLKNGATMPVANTISIATALSSATTDQVNFRQKEFAPNTERLLVKQLICAGLLIVLIFASLLTHSFLQKRTLRNELAASKAETIKVLSEEFKGIESNSIDDMLEEAEKANKKDEQTWFAFKRSPHNSLLNLLLELTRLNREGLGLIVDKISIDQERNLMTLKAQVKDHEALGRLENELKQSELFNAVPRQNDINFTMELPLKTDQEGSS